MTIDIAVEEGPVAPGLEAIPEAGAIVRFEGRVRGEEDARPIHALVYEAYEPMASRQMAKIVEALGSKFPCFAVRIRHRIGTVPVGEIAIVVEVLAAHRGEAFALVAAFMDRLKQDVPIWKMRALPLKP
jgi:molybdopterin synthase catalytic subunit